MFSIFGKDKNKAPSSIAQFSIDGMHCTSCALNIDGNLEDTEGVLSASTNYAKSQTTIEYDPEKVNLDQLVQVIDATGYKANVLDAK